MNTAAAPFTVVLQPSIGNGLAVQSVALVNQILTVNMKRFRGNRKGTLNPSELATVDSQLKAMLQL
jgi:mRNA-degrading endonuclease toxin of MazEF toxin-antitoxin module